jgi:L-fuculose-phosphate aldolase
MDERALRQAICAIGRRMHDRGLVAAWDGNISARLPDGHVLCTPTMVSKGFVTADELCVVDTDCRQISGPKARTTELLLHLVIYRERSDVQAVVHAHPPHACAFAITGTPIPNGALAEVEVFLGVVPTVGYTLPGTSAFAESVVPHLDRTNTLLLANHGSVAFGPSLDQAYGQTEILDAYCRILLLARNLGPAKLFTKEQVGELLALKKRLGYADSRTR